MEMAWQVVDPPGRGQPFPSPIQTPASLPFWLSLVAVVEVEKVHRPLSAATVRTTGLWPEVRAPAVLTSEAVAAPVAPAEAAESVQSTVKMDNRLYKAVKATAKEVSVGTDQSTVVTVALALAEEVAEATLPLRPGEVAVPAVRI